LVQINTKTIIMQESIDDETPDLNQEDFLFELADKEGLDKNRLLSALNQCVKAGLDRETIARAIGKAILDTPKVNDPDEFKLEGW